MDVPNNLNIFGSSPELTLTDDTAPGAKSLKIDVNNDIARIVEKAVVTGNPLINIKLTDNRIGIFQLPDPFHFIHIQRKVGDTEPRRLFSVWADDSGTASEGLEMYSLYCGSFPNITAGRTIPKVFGSAFSSYAQGSGSITTATAVNAYVDNWSTGTVTNAHAFNVPVPSGTGAIANVIGLRVARQTKGTTKNIGFFYGITEPPSGNYAIYADNDNSYFGGNVGIGTLPTATEKLRLRATNSPDNAIYFDVSGNNMTTMLDLRAKDTVGTEIRTLFESSRGGYGSVRVVSNHPLLFSTNNLERAAITNDGRWKYLTPNSAPNNAILLSSQCTAFLDEINNKLKFRVKYSNGVTLKTGEIALV